MRDLVLAAPVRSALEQVIAEHRQEDALRDHGFRPLRRLLLMGPPGTGKTMSARAIAHELHLPLFTIRLDGIITKFMGDTASKLRVVFDAMSQTSGVYFFDEVDALGGRRVTTNDVGEIRRVLNSFLQFLEREDSEGLLLAATNHPGLLDRAIFRRFDSIVEYPLPTGAEVTQVIMNRLALLDLHGVAWKSVEAAAEGLSQSEVTLAAERAAKDVVLSHQVAVGTSALVSALVARGDVPQE